MSHSNVSRGSYKQRLSERIQAGKIVQRLQDFILCDPKTEPDKVLTSTQVNAARILLNRVLPELKAVEVDVGATLSGDIRSIPSAQLLAIISEGPSSSASPTGVKPVGVRSNQLQDASGTPTNL